MVLLRIGKMLLDNSLAWMETFRKSKAMLGRSWPSSAEARHCGEDISKSGVAEKFKSNQIKYVYCEY
jgi:hypothetical protein